MENQECEICDPSILTIAREKRILLADGRFLQMAALVYRFLAGELQVLLITSRETKRWIIPKGWPVPGKTLAEAALQEAYEEAGVRGTVQSKPLGRYTYEKNDTPKGRDICFTVKVFAVHFVHQEKKWPERKQRCIEWTLPEEAARRVNESGLKKLFLGFVDNCKRKMTS